MLALCTEMREAAVQKVLLSGGEPLLSPHLMLLCERLANVGILVDVNTNLLLATEEILQQLWATGVRELTVSLDGSTRAVYERCRPGASLVKLLSALRVAVQLGFTVDLTYVPTALNLDDFEAVVEKTVEIGAASLTVAGLVLMERASLNKQDLVINERQRHELTGRINKVRDDAPIPIRTNRLTTPKPTDKCDAGVSICGIDAAGFMHPCPLYILNSSEVNDLMQRSFKDILQDAVFIIDVPPYPGMTGCKRCPVSSGCPGGCLGIKRIMGIEETSPDPVCGI